MTRHLTERDAMEIIEAGKVGRLGCIYENEPYVVPINYLVHNGEIYSHSLPGRKLDALRAHSRACLQVDQIDNDFHWCSAIAFGKFEELHTSTERRAVLKLLLARFPTMTPVESMIAEDASAPDSVVFRITIDRITGVVEK